MINKHGGRIAWFTMALGLVAVAPPASAVLIAGGNLNINIRDDNGAIDNLQFAGREYYELGTFVSDYGFQLGTDTASFALLNTVGSNAGLVSSVLGGGSSATVTGNYSGIGFVRSYNILAGDILQISTTLTSVDGATVRLFDTADPDQGVPVGGSFATANDVVGGTAQATEAGGFSVLWTSEDIAAVFGFGGGTSPFGLGIASGVALNAFMSTPYDPNGAIEDIGVAVGREFTIAAGGEATFTYNHCYGETAEAAAACSGTAPEPGTLALLGLALTGLGWSRRKLAW